MPSYKALTLALAPGLRCTQVAHSEDVRFPFIIRHVGTGDWSMHAVTAREAWAMAYEHLLAEHWEKALDL